MPKSYDGELLELATQSAGHELHDLGAKLISGMTSAAALEDESSVRRLILNIADR